MADAKTIDNLGPEASIDFAIREQWTKEAEFIEKAKLRPIRTETETVERTPPATEELLGSTAQSSYALFPKRPSINTRITAYAHGRLIGSIGERDDFNNKLKKAPKKLKKDPKNLTKINNFADQFSIKDKDCSHIHGKCGEFSKG